MTKLESLGDVIETDVLVIGGGVSGLWAANRAREFVERVVVVDKGPKDWGGLASWAGGDFIAVLPEENIDDFVKDLVYYYDGLCDQNLVEQIFKESFSRLRDYQRMGCEFLTNSDGKLRGIPQRSLEHVKLYPAKVRGNGGANMVRGLVNETKRLGVKHIGRVQISDFLKHEDRVIGAVGFNTITGNFYIFKADAIILAAGQGGWKTLTDTSTGECMYAAVRAGVEVRNCEFVRVWNKAKLFNWEGQTTLLPLGARFTNANGESFMDKYSPKFGRNTDPHYIVRGMAIEAREGRNPFYLDTSTIKAQDIELVMPQTGWQRLNYDKLLNMGINFFSEKTEWIPQLQHSYMGIIADIHSQTKVPGLFVAGRVQSIEPSVYMGGFALCVTAVTGYIAGETAAQYAKSHQAPNIKEGEVEALKLNLYGLMGKTDIQPQVILNSIQEAVVPYDVCILKNEQSLKKALDKILEIKHTILTRARASEPHHLSKLLEISGIMFVTESYLKASLMRQESRAGHYREDFPDRDDKNWLKWIVVHIEGDKVVLSTEPVPLNTYKHNITRYYMDNFHFPKAGNSNQACCTSNS